VEVEAPVALTGIEVDERIPVLEHRVRATVRNGATGKIEEVRCKFVIGCDGGKSSVRKFMGIPFTGSTTKDKWVRVDGLVETNLPKPRTYCSIESPTHGNVLWVGLDRGRTRIGYAFTQEREEGYENFDQEAAVKEAIAAVKPFEVEFKTVDWWTIYSVGQRIAEEFFTKGSVFLAGDACHTHSSGAAQGMNTGIHDCVNLSWKLSLVLRGLAKPELLETYQAERLPNVQKLVQYDKDISRLMTNRLPEKWTGDPKADLNEILGEIMEEAGSFSSGLGIFYELEIGNPLNVGGDAEMGRVKSGQRGPDVKLLKPGTFEQTRLVSQTPNNAGFYLMVLTGDASITSAAEFVDTVHKSESLSRLCSNSK
jgi:phenol 2-monooxygenase